MRYNTPARSERPWLVIIVTAVLLVNTIFLGLSLSLAGVFNKRGDLAVVKDSAIILGLEQELASLRVELQSVRMQAGLSILVGAGVRVRLYDAVGGFTEDKIVHDTDVRDVINELSAAGAAGITVGDQRLIATSSVRCAGPVILVNHRPVPVDPVTIYAVGDPDVLASSLSLLRSSLLATKGIKLEVEKQERLTLPGYTPLS